MIGPHGRGHRWRRRRAGPLLAAFVVLVAALPVRAAAQQPLTLDQAIELARKNSLIIKSAGTGVQLAEAARSENQTSFYPRIGVRAGASYAPSDPTFGYDPAISDGGEVHAQVGVDHTLYDGGVRSLRDDQLAVDLDRSRFDRKLAERDIFHEVRSGFIRLLRDRDEVDLRRESLRRLENYLNFVRQLAGAGTVPASDVLSARTELATGEDEYRKAGERYAEDRVAFSEMLGLEIDSAVAVVGSLEDLLPPGTGSPPAQGDTGSTALDLRLAQTEISRDSIGIEIAGRELYPKVSVFGDLGLLSSGENLRLPADERYRGLGYLVGLSLELPLVDWGAVDSRVLQRRLEVEQLRDRADFLRRSIASLRKRNLIATESAAGRLASLRGGVSAANDHLLLVRSMYAGGGTRSLEVFNAERLVVETGLSVLDVLAEIQQLRADLIKLDTQ
jgi:outer membrane protein TolC